MTQAHAWSDAALETLARDTGVRLLLDQPSRDAAATDFGHLVRGQPRGVVQPNDGSQVARVLGWAGARGLPVTVRGRGYSQSGQSLAVGGLTLETSRLEQIDPVDVRGRRLTCEAGARWREVLEASVPHGLLPQVHALNLDMSVGGLLSAGGIGANSHRFGPVVADANVLGLEVATPRGELLWCSAGENRELFDAVRGTLGLCGTITRATLALRPLPQRVRIFQLLYDSVEPWLADQLALARGGRCDSLEGFCWAGAKGTRSGPHGKRPFAHWLYGLHVGIDLAGGETFDDSRFLRSLNAWRVLNVEDDEPVSHARRYQPRFDQMRRTGAWEQAHPWFESFLPWSALPQLLPALLDAVPLALGDGHRVLRVERAGAPPFFALPEAPEVGLFNILPMGVPPLDLEDCLEGLRGLQRQVLGAGGKRYLSGFLGELSPYAWKQHHGARHEAWQKARRTFDPRGILGSALVPQEPPTP